MSSLSLSLSFGSFARRSRQKYSAATTFLVFFLLLFFFGAALPTIGQKREGLSGFDLRDVNAQWHIHHRKRNSELNYEKKENKQISAELSSFFILCYFRATNGRELGKNAIALAGSWTSLQWQRGNERSGAHFIREIYPVSLF